mmetsp:Transcript_12765/g.29694  ORF Transcript_12765/g.29694 Transcript_12765/m.29694 type:complete len:118 (+) Transcript_12765:865-1218(+)|eukprot:CAMPEP_0116850896 /NCGR_PEP_ID=MMETSP0418-20121206/16414_1 /TAXON_ID=1158023 /ORGANISM="Astrosyne radiata, Strain 13vi08-1A" /LENGTH=117 /DNA_ID=CAMNT_0004482843 /DNA_START=71 /DNA_END=424 /DNA_ORIENTATION=-
MSLPKGPILSLIEATETDITVEFTPLEGVETYELQYKEHAESWEQHMQTLMVKASGSPTRVTAVGLNPGATYCVRLVCISSSSSSGDRGEPSKELVIDTEQVGCTPTPDSGCPCTIM